MRLDDLNNDCLLACLGPRKALHRLDFGQNDLWRRWLCVSKPSINAFYADIRYAAKWCVSQYRLAALSHDRIALPVFFADVSSVQTCSACVIGFIFFTLLLELLINYFGLLGALNS